MSVIDRINHLQSELKAGIDKCNLYPRASTTNTGVAKILTQILLELGEIKGEVWMELNKK